MRPRSYSAIPTDTPAPAQKVGHLNSKEAGSGCGQSFPATLDAGGLFLASKGDSAVVLDTGATANLACCRRLEHHNRLLEKNEYQSVSTYASTARFRSGDGRLGDVRHAADIPLGVARNKV